MQLNRISCKWFACYNKITCTFTGVAICNKNCTLSAEWVSSSKIICRTSTGLGKHSIIVITRSGGCGTSMVSFTGLPQPRVGKSFLIAALIMHIKL